MVDVVRPPTPGGAQPPKTIEVELIHKYCPHHLPMGDGTFVKQDSTKATLTIPPGIVRLHHEDAQIVLRAEVARPTEKTFKEM